MSLKEKQLYLDLAEKLGHRSEYLARILQYAATPPQAQIMMSLPQVPLKATTAALLAKELGMEIELVQEELEVLFRKGLVFPRKFHERQEWRLARGHEQIHDSMQCSSEFSPSRAILHDLWLEYDERERYEILANQFSETPKPTQRVIPAWKSVMNNPKLQAWEDWREIIKKKNLISVAECPCRAKVHACQRPLEVCLNFDRGAEYDIASGHGRKISADEAIEIMDYAASSGLVGESINVREISTAMCNCCSDCCVIWVPLIRYGIPISKKWERSRYQAKINQDVCTGCQECIDKCNFEAIEMSSVPGSKKLKAVVDSQKCFGCGCCYMVCEYGAITMECVRPESHVPESM